MVTIVNSGFENPVQEDGDFSFSTPPGWELFDPNELIPLPTNSVGVWNPTVSNHPDGVPEGEQVGFIFLGDPPGSGTVALTQTLTNTLEANTQYTLSVEVGDPLPNPGSSALDGFPGYQIQLLAGDTVLTLDDNSLNITEGTFETSVISFKASEYHPNLGEALEIRLVNLLEEEGEIVNFDNVRVELSGIVIKGTNQDDTLTGGAGDDTIAGKQGDDILNSLNGNDMLFGGKDDDLLFGGDGNDIVAGDGESISELLNEDPGNDTLVGGNGEDTLYIQKDDLVVGGGSVSSTSNSAFNQSLEDDPLKLSDTEKTNLGYFDGVADNFVFLDDGNGYTATIVGYESIDELDLSAFGVASAADFVDSQEKDGGLRWEYKTPKSSLDSEVVLRIDAAPNELNFL